jgi:RNA polymerase sigma-70 factor (ECF subfamily)
MWLQNLFSPTARGGRVGDLTRVVEDSVVGHLELVAGKRGGKEPSRGEEGRAQREGPLEDQVFDLVYRQMRVLAGPGPDLDDLVQTAAERALRALSSFEGRAELGTWTHRICYVTLLKHRRWCSRWYRRFTPSDGDFSNHADPRISAVDSLHREERCRRLRRALEYLSPKRRAVVVLHDLVELPVGQIADIVGAKPNTVRSRLRDGRKQLAEALRRDPYFGDDACRSPEDA